MDHARNSREEPPHFTELVERYRTRAQGAEDIGAASQLVEFAWACSATQPENSESALELLSGDGEPSIRNAVARGLQHLLSTLDGLSRVAVLLRWASSTYSARREAVARALDSDLAALGVTTALECLVQDECSHVRAAAQMAATRRSSVLGS